MHHGLMNGKVEEIRSQLARFREVAEAYLVCRAPTQVSEQPLFILGIERNLKWYQYQSEYADTKLIQRLCEEIVLPGEGFIVMFSPKTKKIKKGAKAVPKSRIYVRPAC